MSYRLTAVCLSAGGHHGFVAELSRYERGFRERERAECGPDTLHPVLSNTFDTPIPFARSSISFLEERDHILIPRPENVETIWTFLSVSTKATLDIYQKYRVAFGCNTSMNNVSL